MYCENTAFGGLCLQITRNYTQCKQGRAQPQRIVVASGAPKKRKSIQQKRNAKFAKRSLAPVVPTPIVDVEITHGSEDLLSGALANTPSGQGDHAANVETPSPTGPPGV